MTDSGESTGDSPPPVPNLLFPYCKIVSSLRGYLIFNEDNLNEIINECLSAYNLPKDIPVSALAIVGPPSSGKSFLTNLLIQYYKCGGDGEWLQRLTKTNDAGEQEKVTGFAFDSVQLSPSLFRPDEEDKSSSGIYLWPQPFIMELYGSERVIWIFHLCVGDDSSEEDIQTLEKFLLLACSRLAEINVGDEDFRILRGKSKLDLSKQSGKICNSVVFLFRSQNALNKQKSRATTDSEAKQEMVKMINSFKNSEMGPSVLDTIQHINIVRMNDTPDALHDEEGCLNPALNKMVKTALRNVIATITDDSEVLPQKGENGKVVCFEGFPQFIQSCVHSVNLVTGIKCPVSSVPKTEKPPELKGIENCPQMAQQEVDYAMDTGNGDDKVEDMEVDIDEVEENAKKPEEEAEKRKLDEEEEGWVVVQPPSDGSSSKFDDQSVRKEGQSEIITHDDPRRAEMTQTAIQSIQKFKSMVYPTAEKWLMTHLSLNNISKISTMYEPLIALIKEEGQAQVDSKLWPEMDQILEEECEIPCRVFLSNVQSILEVFYQGMMEQFNLHHCFLSEELEKVGLEEFSKLSLHLVPSTDNPEITRLINVSYAKLIENFREKNNKIHNDETTLASTLVPEVVPFYNEEMSNILIEEVYPRYELKRIHDRIIVKLLEVVRMSFRLSDGADKISKGVEAALITLESELQAEFAAHSKKNASKLKKMLGDLGKCIAESKKCYVGKIEEFLERNPNGVNPTDLHWQHEDILTDAKKMLEEGIRERLGNREPLEMHAKNIETQAGSYFRSVKETNDDNLKVRLGENGEKEEPKTGEILGAKSNNVEESGQGGRDKNEVNSVPDELAKTMTRVTLEEPRKAGGDNEETSTSQVTVKVDEQQVEVISQVETGLPLADIPDQDKQDLLDKCKEIQEQLETRTAFKFRSTTAKSMFAKKVEDTAIAAKGAGSKEEIQELRVNLEQWETKYRM